MPWIDSARPVAPGVLSVKPLDTTVRIELVRAPNEKKKIKCYRLYGCYNEEYTNNFYNAQLLGSNFDLKDTTVFFAPLRNDRKFARFYVTSVDEDDVESKPYPNWPLKLEAVKIDRQGWSSR